MFFICLLIGFCISAADKKTFYYYKNTDNQKTEITKAEYFNILNGEKITEGKDPINLNKEDTYDNKNAIMASTLLFILLMIFVSVFELRKRKNSAT